MQEIMIKIRVPDGMSVEVAELAVHPEEVQAADAMPTLPEVDERLQTGKRSLVSFMTGYIERCATELGCTTIVPEGKRTDYLNTFPPPRHKHKRVSSLTVTSGRLEVYCDPALAQQFPPAQEDKHNGVPVQVKIYLTSNEAVDAAIELTRRAIDGLDD